MKILTNGALTIFHSFLIYQIVKCMTAADKKKMPAQTLYVEIEQSDRKSLPNNMWLCLENARFARSAEWVQVKGKICGNPESRLNIFNEREKTKSLNAYFSVSWIKKSPHSDSLVDGCANLHADTRWHSANWIIYSTARFMPDLFFSCNIFFFWKKSVTRLLSTMFLFALDF